MRISSSVSGSGCGVRFPSIQQRPGGHHHPRRAEAALEPVLALEALLDRVQPPVDLQALDRPDLVAGGGGRQHRARLDRLGVHEHDARAAVGRVTPPVGAGQAAARRAGSAPAASGARPRACISSPLTVTVTCIQASRSAPRASAARSAARRSARVVSTPATWRLYSADPRWSATGEHRRPRRGFRRLDSSSAGACPRSSASASAHDDLARRRRPARRRPRDHAGRSSSVSAAPAAATAQSPTRRATFS